MEPSRLKIPETSPTRYLSGIVALNIPSEADTGDWHQTQIFFVPHSVEPGWFVIERGQEVQDAVGYALERAQAGEIVGYAEPMKGNLRDVIEIRTPDDTGNSTYRAAYTTKLGDVVYFLDIFKKKSTQGIKTPQKDLDRIAGRLRMAKEHYEKNYEGK